MNIEKEINKIKYMINCMPGTILQRTLLLEGDIGWTLGIGCMNQPKTFFTGSSIEECIEKAEKWRKK